MHPTRLVIIPCLLSMLWVIFVGSETLLWRVSDHYPSALTRVRYVNDLKLLTPESMAEICHLPLTQPELREKRDSLYLRCGTPGVEGVYRIEIWRG